MVKSKVNSALSHYQTVGVSSGVEDATPHRLVQMLMVMDDPKSSGPAMAVALLTTFYGSILANLLFLPIAGKLKGRREDEAKYKQVIVEGLSSIQLGDNPRVIEQKLNTYLSPTERALVSQK